VQAFDLAGESTGDEQPAAQGQAAPQGEAPGDGLPALPGASEQSAVDKSAEPTPLRGMCWLAAAPLVWRQLARMRNKQQTQSCGS